MTAKGISEFLHSREAAAIMIVAAFAATIAAWSAGEVIPIQGSHGLAFPSANMWISSGFGSMLAGIATIALTVLMSFFILRAFNIMRSQSSLWSGLFVVMLAAFPSACCQLYGGNLMCMVLSALTFLLFSCFGEPGATRRVFLIFFILSFCTLFEYAFALYSIVMLIGLAQMRIFNLRSAIAAIIGLVTPFWVLLGTGILRVDDLRLPAFVGTFTRLEGMELLAVFGAISVTIFIGIAALATNLVKIIGYNAKARSTNGFMAIMLIATMLLVCVDYNSLSTYIPTLAFAASYELALLFVTRRAVRQYIAVFGVIIIYIILYVISWLL